MSKQPTRRQQHEAERVEMRKLVLQAFDIGYKALARKLHPDNGGSNEAMARLNYARDRLKTFLLPADQRMG
jgi:hypothetical protein